MAELALWVLLFVAGVLGGCINAVAGGGSFVTFPALIAAGLDPLTANASNAVALYPGSAAAVPAYRRELAAAGRRALAIRCAIALAFGLAGALLLLWVGGEAFEAAVPWLLLAATATYAFGPRIRALAEAAGSAARPAKRVLEALVATYGGFFGAGLGVMVMAVLTVAGLRGYDVQNAQKNLVVSVIKGIAVVTFIVAGAVAWPQTLAVFAGATVGGYGGARLARRIPEGVLRATVIAAGLGLSAAYLFG